jgi:signal transduction histidine kinase
MSVLLQHEAIRYSISIRAELAADLPQVLADRVQLQQVLMNLMLNGIEAMKDMNPAGELTIKSQQENNHLLISVSDTGVGLAPEQADQIFKAFFTTKPQGTGMGLPISRSIIESHGGRLWPTANAGRGATFHLTLPSEVEMKQPGQNDATAASTTRVNTRMASNLSISVRDFRIVMPDDG